MHEDNENRPDPDRATLWVIGGGLGVLALIAGVASYLHTLAVAQHADGHTLVALGIPVLADLTIATASANMLDAHGHGERGKRFPWLSLASLAVSVVVTLGANKAAGNPAQVPTWLVNVWPPVAFMMGLESLLDYRRRVALRSAKRIIPGGIPCPHGVGMTRDDAVRIAYEHARDCEGSPVTLTALAAGFGIDRKTVGKLVASTPERGQGGTSATPPRAEHGSRPGHSGPPAGDAPQDPDRSVASLAGAGGSRGRPHAPAAPQAPRPGPDTPLGPAGAARSPSAPGELLGTATAGTAHNGQRPAGGER